MTVLFYYAIGNIYDCLVLLYRFVNISKIKRKILQSKVSVKLRKLLSKKIKFLILLVKFIFGYSQHTIQG